MNDRRGCRWIACIALGGLLTLASAASHAETPAFRRGIGLSHSMSWAPVEALPSRAFVFPPFADRPLRAEEVQAVRSAGFDFVRFAVDPGPFLQFRSPQREHLDRLLMEQVALMLSFGLSVVVDLHPSDLHPHFTGQALTRGVETPVFQDYLQVVGRLAGLLDALKSRRVALELMNEPPGTTEAWQPMQEAAYRAARRTAPGLTLVLTGAHDGMPEGLLTLRTAAFRSDPVVLYTFHYYEPFQFTHQGASWNAARHLMDVPYPAQARPLRDSLDATAAAIAASDLPQARKATAMAEARRHLESYSRSNFDRVAMGRSLDRIVAWRKSNGIAADRILLGEFGAMKSDRQAYGLRAGERRQWFADVRREAEARGFIWAAWVYRLGAFALTMDERSTAIDPAIIDALGLARRMGAVPAD